MRILVAAPGPNFSVQDVYHGWVDALRELLGKESVFIFNLDARLAFYNSTYVALEGQEGVFRKALDQQQAIDLAINGLPAALFKIRPHVLFVISGFFFHDDMQTNPILDQARALGTKVVVLHTESPYEDERQLKVAAHADLNLVNDYTNLADFRAIGPSYYQGHCYRPGIHHPGPAVPGMESDFAFIGTSFPSRIAFFEAMNFEGIDVALGGHWGRLPEDSPLQKYLAHDIQMCMDNETTANAYRSTKASINLYRQESPWPINAAQGQTCGPREIELAACETFFLRDPRTESDVLFPMLPTFHGPDDASEKLRWWLAHDVQRYDAAAAAHQRIADRTFHNAAKVLLRHLEP